MIGRAFHMLSILCNPSKTIPTPTTTPKIPNPFTVSRLSDRSTAKFNSRGLLVFLWRQSTKERTHHHKSVFSPVRSLIDVCVVHLISNKTTGCVHCSTAALSFKVQKKKPNWEFQLQAWQWIIIQRSTIPTSCRLSLHYPWTFIIIRQSDKKPLTCFRQKVVPFAVILFLIGVRMQEEQLLHQWLPVRRPFIPTKSRPTNQSTRR